MLAIYFDTGDFSYEMRSIAIVWPVH